jgi:hypothetical protein
MADPSGTLSVAAYQGPSRGRLTGCLPPGRQLHRLRAIRHGTNHVLLYQYHLAAVPIASLGPTTIADAVDVRQSQPDDAAAAR